MKKFYLLLWSCLLLTACSDPDDQPSNQNEQNNLPEIDQRSLQHQLDFVQFVEASQQLGGELTRMYYLFGNTYEDWYQGDAAQRANQMWAKAYDNLLPGIDETLALDPSATYAKHRGVLKALKAYVLMTLVDYYGPIPFQVDWPADAQVAAGDVVYDRIMDYLDEAEHDLLEPAPVLETDLFYDNQFELWSRLVGSLKLNLLANKRLVDPGAQGQFEAIIASGNYIQGNSQNFEFRYGNGQAAPFDMHPQYRDDYAGQFIRSYRSNYFMNSLLFPEDPRRRFYAYRQTDCTPGSQCDPDGGNEVLLMCSEQPRLIHYPAMMTQCFGEVGYWGRDHGRSEGIPPDAFYRTAPGLYPVGGNFDDETFLGIDQVTTAAGLGILPIVQSHDADWLQAEWAMASGNEALARQFLMVGTQKSIDRVLQFTALDPDVDQDYVPTAAEVTQFITRVGDWFDDGDSTERWSWLLRQKLTAQYGNGNSMYAAYRRSGYPRYLQYHVNPNPGPFPRSLYYPIEAVMENPNLDQKSDLAQQVFWDINPAYPVFPAAN